MKYFFAFVLCAALSFQGCFLQKNEPESKLEIISHPHSAVYTLGETPSSFGHAYVSTDAGDVSFRWYRNSVNSTEGGELVADTSAYTPPADMPGTWYYYIVITGEKNGRRTSATSNIAEITVVAVRSAGIYINSEPKPARGSPQGVDFNLAAALAWLDENASGLNTYFVIIEKSEARAPMVIRRPLNIVLSGGRVETVIRLEGRGALFTLRDGTKLVLDKNITLAGVSNNVSALVVVESGAQFEMRGETKITGNTSSGLTSGGVFVTGSFVMTGGEISGNSCAGIGGGVYIAGGGVDDAFTLTGGVIANNRASQGGGVFVSSNFTMQGGELRGNTASLFGGGVYVTNLGLFTKTGGLITSGQAAKGKSVYAGEGKILEETIGETHNLNNYSDGEPGGWSE